MKTISEPVALAGSGSIIRSQKRLSVKQDRVQFQFECHDCGGRSFTYSKQETAALMAAAHNCRI